jgi:putative flippase GtrA
VVALAAQLARFGVVGIVAFAVDIGLFNVLLYAGADPLLAGHPLWAKVCSTAVATVVSWVGNRYWTFRHRRRPNIPHELVLFVGACTVGLGIGLGILWVSHYALGFTSPLADNIAANVVGLAAGTAFRFWAYSTFVFNHDRARPADAPTDPPENRPTGLPAR